MSSWSCPHDNYGVCERVSGARCDPGMRGCVLHGKVVFAEKEKNTARNPTKAPVPDRRTSKPPKRRLPF